jgi:hypothetical protein
MNTQRWGVWNLTHNQWAIKGNSYHISYENALAECEAWSRFTSCEYEPRLLENQY